MAILDREKTVPCEKIPSKPEMIAESLDSLYRSINYFEEFIDTLEGSNSIAKESRDNEISFVGILNTTPGNIKDSASRINEQVDRLKELLLGRK